MRRIPIQLDDETYAALRKRAFAENRSIASIVRECVANAHQTITPRSIDEFRFVGSGRSPQRGRKPVSADHDRALAEAIAPRRRRR